MMIAYSFRNQDLNLNTELRASLIRIWGVGWHKAILMTAKLGIGTPFFTSNLNVYYFTLISYLLHNLVVSKTRILRLINLRIKTLIEIGSYRGICHSLFLPTRGQRTRTNAQTRKKLRWNKTNKD